jgi:hypothetical protein
MCDARFLSALFSRKLRGVWLGVELSAVASFLTVAKAATETPAAVPATPSAQPLILSGKSMRGDSDKISTVISEVIRLVDAKVDAAVIKAYINNAPMTYNPSATELIALQQHGAGTDTLIALLQRASEAMARTSQTAPTIQSLPAMPVYRYAPQTEYQSAPESDASPVDTTSTNYVSSGGSPVYYAAPTYYPGFGPPGPPPERPRPPLHEEWGRDRGVKPLNHSDMGRSAPPEGQRSISASPPAGHAAPGGSHGAASPAPGRSGGLGGGRGR